jgi:3-oxoacyl-[acyl-carrier-protein] synthase II
VVVTGIGLITGLGARARTWSRIQDGHHSFQVLDLPTAPGTAFYGGSPAGDVQRSATEVLAQATRDACDDARIAGGPGAPASREFDPDRAGVVIGMSKGDLGRLATIHEAVLRAAPEVQSWLATWSTTWPDAVARWTASTWDFRGPCLAPVAACATGLIAALQGAALIRRGRCDLVLAGAGDSSLDPLVQGAFRRMGILARVDDEPGRAVRPWDKQRSGFLVGAGAAVLVLERDDHARARGITPYAQLAGGASGADAYHMTDLNADPSVLAHVIGRAFANAGVAAEEIDHVNVHGTATRSNDPLECRAIRRALGPQAERVACSANKSQFGHLLGAAGAAELAITCLAVHDGFVPPTLNLTEPDPACDLDGTPLVGCRRPIAAALKLSIGFGGHMAAAVVKHLGDRRVSHE